MSKARGFTLIEMMIVLAIIGAVVAMAMPYMNNRSSKTKAFLRQLTVMSRELHTRAKLQGAVYRLVIDLKETSGSERPVQTYWVEKSNGKTVLKPNEEEDAMKQASERRATDDEEKPKDPRGFEMDTTLTKEPRELPSGIYFDRVELTRLEKPITGGKAYIHYMPEGLVDEAALHIKGEKTQAWTISIHPLTGKAELISKSVSLQDMKAQ
ncbi:MAG: type II secretion system protein [Bdellovibrionales bacterium]|nr:type II secretion system protein [Bdellovibrionales bacterium]